MRGKQTDGKGDWKNTRCYKKVMNRQYDLNHKIRTQIV